MGLIAPGQPATGEANRSQPTGACPSTVKKFQKNNA
jgi:hypothetical protein